MRVAPLVLASMALTTTHSHAADFPQTSFTHHDWEIACDNTRTCRAAGYQADDAKRNASILLTRHAGPATSVQVELQMEETDEPVPERVQLQIDERDFGQIGIGGTKGMLPPAQATTLLNALPKANRLAWTAGKRNWTISLKGANAV